MVSAESGVRAAGVSAAFSSGRIMTVSEVSSGRIIMVSAGSFGGSKGCWLRSRSRAGSTSSGSLK